MKKKALALFMAAVLVATMSACAGTNDESTDRSSSGTSSTVTSGTDKDNKSDKDEVLTSQKPTNNTDKKTDETDKSDKDSKKDTDSKDDNKNTASSTSSSNTGSTNKPSNSGSGSSGSNKPSTGGSSNGSSSSSSKPSGGSGNTGSGTGNSGSSSKPTEPTNPPAHQHSYTTVISSSAGDCCHDGSVTKQCSCGATKTENTGRGNHGWVTNYKTIHHDAVYEEQPVYEWRGWYECLKCGAQFDNVEACGGHCLTVCNSRYTVKKEQVQTGTTSVKVQDAWDEQVEDGQICSICGAKK